MLASQLRSERSPRRSDSCRLIQYTSRGLPASPLGFEPKARRFDSCLVFHSAETPKGPCRTEVETEVVSAVRAPESRLARRRCELRSRVPHEDAVSAASKLAQSGKSDGLRCRLSWVRLPHLHQPVKLAPEERGASVPHRGAPAAPPIICQARKGETAEKRRPQRALRLER